MDSAPARVPASSLSPSCPSSSSGAVRHLVSVPGKDGEDLLLVSADACELLGGQELAPRWTFSAPRVLRYRSPPAACALVASWAPPAQPPGSPVEVGEGAGVPLQRGLLSPALPCAGRW